VDDVAVAGIATSGLNVGDRDFDSIEKARALALSDKLRNTMQRAGVRSAPDVWLVTQS